MKKTPSRLYLLFTICCFICAILPSQSHAHRMLIDCIAEDGTVLADIFFPNGRPAKDVRVEVYNSDEILHTSGRTDAEGRFSFDAKGKTYFRVVAIGELGHKAEQKLSLEETPSRPPGESAEDGHVDSKVRRRVPLPFREVFAGFGYIFGAAGVLMYFKARSDLKKAKNK